MVLLNFIRLSRVASTKLSNCIGPYTFGISRLFILQGSSRLLQVLLFLSVTCNLNSDKPELKEDHIAHPYCHLDLALNANCIHILLFSRK
jgi:hypothetical protein